MTRYENSCEICCQVCQGKSLICQGKVRENVREFRKTRPVATMEIFFKMDMGSCCERHGAWELLGTVEFLNSGYHTGPPLRAPEKS